MKLQGFENNETNQLEKLGVLRVNITGGMQTTLIHFIFVMERGLLFGILKNHTPVASHSDDRKKKPLPTTNTIVTRNAKLLRSQKIKPSIKKIR